MYIKISMLNPKQRNVLAEKLADLGNIAVGSLVFGYVLRSEAFNQFSLMIGVTLMIITYGFAIILERTNNRYE